MLNTGVRFVQPHTENFFDTEGPSPELLALGTSLSSPNELTTLSFRKEDKKWKFMSEVARFSAKLAVFQAALIDLLSRADDLGVTAEDRAVILALLLSIAEQSFSQALNSTFFTFENRRLLALTSLGLQKSAESVAVKTLPLEGPHLFAGHFLEAVDSEISMHKRASDLAAKLKPTPAFPPFRSSARRPFRGSRARGSRGSRGGPRLPSFGRVRQPPFQAAGRGASRFSFTSPPPPPPHNDYPAPIPHEDRGPVGGRLSLFLSQWRRITDDAFVLSVVAHGYIISPLKISRE